MSDTTRGRRSSRRAAATTHRRRRRVLVAVGVGALLVAGAVGFAWWRLEGNISRLDVTDDLGDRPQVAEGPLNVLLIGSDKREGEDVPGASLTSGARSDTTLLAHVSADREHVTVVSIPRDSMVPAPPDCSTSAPRDEWVDTQWNSTFSVGGPACLIRTIEGNTGLFVNHFAVVDFNGFRDMVDALGGVPVCTPEAIDDPKAKLMLPAGRHVLDGDQSLGYVRARQTLGDGSDLGRIERQQAFLSSVVQEATRTSLLLRPDRLFGFLDAATKSLTTDEDFGLRTMQGLATSVKDIGMENVQFLTVPLVDYGPDPNRVAWAPEAEVLWQTLRDDGVVGEGADPGAAASPEPLTVSPVGITVQVVNATAAQGLASEVAAALEVQGFPEVATSSTGERPVGVVVEHGTGQEEAARTVAAAFEGATVRVDAALGDTVRVTLGAGAPPVQEIPNRTGSTPLPTPSVTAPSPSPTASIETRTADQDICS